MFILSIHIPALSTNGVLSCAMCICYYVYVCVDSDSVMFCNQITVIQLH